MAVLSVNQLTSETRKAALGKGASFGVADDIARAIQWLAHYNIVPSSELAAYLTAPLESAPHKPCFQDDIISQIGDNDDGFLSLCDVMAALDFLEAYHPSHLVLSQMRYPQISLALTALRQTPHMGSLTSDTGQPLTGQSLPDLCRMSQPNLTLTLTLTPYQPEIAPDPPLRIEIDDAAYGLLKKAAFETYVPSSEKSREAGAGAGLHDND